MYFSFVDPAAAVEKASAEDFIHVFVNHHEHLTNFLEHVIKVRVHFAFIRTFVQRLEFQMNLVVRLLAGG